MRSSEELDAVSSDSNGMSIEVIPNLSDVGNMETGTPNSAGKLNFIGPSRVQHNNRTSFTPHPTILMNLQPHQVTELAVVPVLSSYHSPAHNSSQKNTPSHRDMPPHPHNSLHLPHPIPNTKKKTDELKHPTKALCPFTYLIPNLAQLLKSA